MELEKALSEILAHHTINSLDLPRSMNTGFPSFADFIPANS